MGVLNVPPKLVQRMVVYLVWLNQLERTADRCGILRTVVLQNTGEGSGICRGRIRIGRNTGGSMMNKDDWIKLMVALVFVMILIAIPIIGCLNNMG
jgi:hypothetical protein